MTLHLDGRTHRRTATVVHALRRQLLEELYMTLDSDSADQDARAAARAQVAGMLEGRVFERVPGRFVEVMLTDLSAVREVLSIVLPLDGSRRPLHVHYEVQVPGLGADAHWRASVPYESPLYCLAEDALQSLRPAEL